MNIGIIGYGSMGKMLARKFASSGFSEIECALVSNRSKEKLQSVETGQEKANGTKCGKSF